MKNVAPYGITPPCIAIPLRIAPIPCSRTPKWTFRPPGGASGRNSPPSFMTVSVEGDRSADPPGVRREPDTPLLLRLKSPVDRLPEMGPHVVGHEEGGRSRPSQVLLR